MISDTHPIVEYESWVALYKLLNVIHLLGVHWSDNSEWIMVGQIYKQVIEETRRLISLAHYLVVTIDDVTAIDNSTYLFVHAYIVQDWLRVPLLVSL